MRFYTWQVEFSVADLWVQDGFDLEDADQVADLLLTGRLSCATCDEVRARILLTPDADAIKREQGYRLPAPVRPDRDTRANAVTHARATLDDAAALLGETVNLAGLTADERLRLESLRVQLIEIRRSLRPPLTKSAKP